MCYSEENISKQIEIPSLLTVFLSVPLKKLPWKRGGSFLTVFLLVPFKNYPEKEAVAFYYLPYKSLENKKMIHQKDEGSTKDCYVNKNE